MKHLKTPEILITNSTPEISEQAERSSTIKRKIRDYELMISPKTPAHSRANNRLGTPNSIPPKSPLSNQLSVMASPTTSSHQQEVPFQQDASDVSTRLSTTTSPP